MNRYKNIFVIVISLCFIYLILHQFYVSIFAADNSNTFNNSIASMKTELQNKEDNTYRVTVSVPGEDPIEIHDEIIVMIDGSTSLGSEWDSMKSALIELGSYILNGKNNVKLTLMAFGISPNVVASHISTLDELKNSLPENPKDLRYGRSSTNCSAAFEGMYDYISKHDSKTLNKAYVLFITDGGVNMNTKEYQWFNIKPSFYNIASAQMSELYAINKGANASDASKKIFINDLSNMITLSKNTDSTWSKLKEKYYINLGKSNDNDLIYLIKQYINALSEQNGTSDSIKQKIVSTNTNIDFENIETELNNLENIYKISQIYTKIYDTSENVSTITKWIDTVWEDFYRFSNLDISKSYPIHICEKAVLDYQYTHNFYIEETFITRLLYADYKTDAGLYAINSGKKLSKIVDNIYLLQYGNDNRAVWMETLVNEHTTNNISLTKAGELANVKNELANVLTNIVLTPFKDVNIVNYTSKWVILSPETIKIVDTNNKIVAEYDAENSNPSIGLYTYKWTDISLCKDKPPLIVKKVSSEDYIKGGQNVIGNSNGDIYNIVWNIKDGALTRSEQYRMEYIVKVDVEEDGFEYGLEYPSNGDTTLNYTDVNDEPQTDSVKIPDVAANKTPLIPTPTPSIAPNSITTQPILTTSKPTLAPTHQPQKTPSSITPHTGDSNNLLHWILLLVISFILTLITIRVFKLFQNK